MAIVNFKIPPAVSVDPCFYDEDYFERGIQTQKSGYQNYSWLPELTIKMAHHLVQKLPIKKSDKVIDFGCAKGFLVKALRILDVECYGVDVSQYAIDRVDPDVRDLCDHISNVYDGKCFQRNYEWLIAKDVFEHMTEDQLIDLLQAAHPCVDRIFSAIPLGKEDGSGFIIPEYDRDITHVTAKPLDWWLELFYENNWNVDSVNYRFRGVKDSWTDSWPTGNAFILLSRI